MSWRTVIISEQAKLDCKMGYMVIRGAETHRILLGDIHTLLIENPAVSLTGVLLAELVKRKVKVIFCDEKRNPAAELLPYHGSHDSTQKIRVQTGWSSDVKAMVWREIVMEKISKQADFLEDLGLAEQSAMLYSYVGQTEQGDTTNREGHAAKVYFNALFGMSFTRSEDSPVNDALNYGYSIILSAFTRETAINGYLCQLGIFHDNVFNHFNLACDLMEPFRILVDRKVVAMKPAMLGPAEKYELWKLLDSTVKINGKNENLKNAVSIYTRSVFEAINDGDTSKIKFYSFDI